MARPFRPKGRSCWCVKFKDRHGIWRTETGFRTRKEADQFLEIVHGKESLLRRLAKYDLIDLDAINRSERGQVGIHDSIPRWAEWLESKKVTSGYRREQERAAAYAADLLGILMINQINDEQLHRLDRMLRETDRSERTRALYVTSLKSLKSFVLNGPRLVVRANKGNVQPSRALTVAEIERLRRVLCERFNGRAPTDATKARWFVYFTLLRTGLRWTEAARLLWSHIDWEWPAIELPGETTKNRVGASIPIASDLLDVLKARRDVGVMFRLIPARKRWLNDLHAAGIAYRTDDGQADRKCMRLTFSSWLAAAGISEREQILLNRHGGASASGLSAKAVRLTRNTYTDLRLIDLHGAIERVVEWHQTERHQIATNAKHKRA